MKNFRKLIVWEKGIEITKTAYQLSENLPSQEKYRIIDQLNRAALSIPLNIAEGCSRKSEKEFRHYLSISLGSAFEVETILVIIEELSMIPSNQLIKLKGLVNEEEKMLNALIHRPIN